MVQIQRHTIALGLAGVFTAVSAAFIAGNWNSINWSDFMGNQFPVYCGVGSLTCAGGCAIAGAVVYQQYKKSLNNEIFDATDQQKEAAKIKGEHDQSMQRSIDAAKIGARPKEKAKKKKQKSTQDINNDRVTHVDKLSNSEKVSSSTQ